MLALRATEIQWRSFFAITMIILCAFLSACGFLPKKVDTYDYKFIMEVETTDGVQSRQTIHSVSISDFSDSFARSRPTKFEGNAVGVSFGSTGKLVVGALTTSDEPSSWGSGAYLADKVLSAEFARSVYDRGESVLIPEELSPILIFVDGEEIRVGRVVDAYEISDGLIQSVRMRIAKASKEDQSTGKLSASQSDGLSGANALRLRDGRNIEIPSAWIVQR